MYVNRKYFISENNCYKNKIHNRGLVMRKPDLLCIQTTKAQLPASVLHCLNSNNTGLFSWQEHLYFFKA